MMVNPSGEPHELRPPMPGVQGFRDFSLYMGHMGNASKATIKQNPAYLLQVNGYTTLSLDSTVSRCLHGSTLSPSFRSPA